MRQLIENKRLTYLTLGVLITLVTTVLYLTVAPEVFIGYLKLVVVGLYLVNVATSLFIQKLPVYHPYVIFLGMFFLFIVNRIFFDVLGGTDFAQTNMFSDYKFDIGIQKTMLVNIAIALWGLQLGSLLACEKYKKTEKFPESKISWTKVGLILFYIGLPFLVYQFMKAGLEVMEKGYGTKLADNLEYRNTVIVTLMSRISLAGYVIYMAALPRSKWFYLHLSFFLIAYSLQLMQGMRGAVMCMYLFLFYYIFTYRQVKLRATYLIVFVVMLFVVALFIGRFREHKKLLEGDNCVKEFVYNQGVTLQVLGYAIEYKDEINYAFYDFFGQTRFRLYAMKARINHEEYACDKEEIMDRFHYLSFQLTNKVNPQALKGGWDMASSYLAELYLLCREWMMLLGNILIGFLTVFLINKFEKLKWGRIFIMLILPSWLYIPRDSLFDFVADNLSNLFFVVAILGTIFFVEKYCSKIFTINRRI